MSQGHNTLPRLGLEPGLSASEPWQCTDHWTTEQSCGVGVPTVQLTMHIKSSTLYGRTVVQSYGRTSKFFPLDGLLLFCVIMELRSASSAINSKTKGAYHLIGIFWLSQLSLCDVFPVACQQGGPNYKVQYCHIESYIWRGLFHSAHFHQCHLKLTTLAKIKL